MSYPPTQPPYGPPPGEPPYGPPPYGQPPYAQTPPTNGKATAALVTGLATLVLSWCCGFGILGVIAIVLGVKGRKEIATSGGAQSGDGLALTGIITGAVAIVVGLLALAFVIFAVIAGSREWSLDTGRSSTF